MVPVSIIHLHWERGTLKCKVKKVVISKEPLFAQYTSQSAKWLVENGNLNRLEHLISYDISVNINYYWLKLISLNLVKGWYISLDISFPVLPSVQCDHKPKAEYFWLEYFALRHLTIILRNRAKYHLILSRQGHRPNQLKSGDIPQDWAG